MADDVETGQPRRIPIQDIRVQDIAGPEPAPAASPDLASVQPEAWAEAQRRLAIIKPLSNNPDRTRRDVEDAAAGAGVDAATLYRWMKEFEASWHVSSLIPRKKGRTTGKRMLAAQQEALIAEAIETEYLTKQHKLPQPVIDKVWETCGTTMPKPSAGTIRRRIAELDMAQALRRRGDREGARKLTPIRGTFPETTHPMEVVQIDHTPADVIVVDHEREPLGRPWITLAIDVLTRMVVGIYISLDHPNAHAVGLVICQAALPKQGVLAALDLPGDWPVWGRIGRVFVDNAKEFRSTVLQQACDEHGIGLEYRPPGTPHFGGIIERMMGNTAKILRNLPGATFSSPAERKAYDSRKEAVLTLDEFERWFTDYIVNFYNIKLHSGIKTTPLAKLKEAVIGTASRPGSGLIPLHPDSVKLRLDFLPAETRTMQRYGFQLDHVRYWSDALTRWIAKVLANPAGKRKFIIRRDPHRISPIWFWDPDLKQYVEIPYANLSRPIISLWELRAAQARLRAAGAKHVDEEKLMASVQRRRAMVEDAQTKTTVMRKEAHHARRTRRHASQAAVDASSQPARKPHAGSEESPDEDIYAKPAELPDVIDLDAGLDG